MPGEDPRTGRGLGPQSAGRLAALLELGSGFHPELSGRENVYLNGSHPRHVPQASSTRRFDEIVDFSGIEHFIDQPVKNYSSGMYVRLGFAVAINVDPDVLLVDEVLAVGDAAFQRKCEERFADFRAAGRTVVLCQPRDVHPAQHVRRRRLARPRSAARGRAAVRAGRRLRRRDPRGPQWSTPTAAPGWARARSRWSGSSCSTPPAASVTGFRTGDAVRLRLHYAAPRARSRTRCSATRVETLDGIYLWAHNSRDGGMVPDAVEGAGQSTCRAAPACCSPASST